MARKLPAEVQAILSASDAGLFATTVALVRSYLENHPDSQRGWLDLGHALVQLCRFDEARSAYETALGLATNVGADDPIEVVYGELGHLCRAQGNFVEARSWYQKQIDRAPDEALGYLFLGNLEITAGNRPKAIELLRRGCECSQAVDAEIYLALAHAYASNEQYFDSKQQLRKCLQLDPHLEPAKRLLKDVNNLANR